MARASSNNYGVIITTSLTNSSCGRGGWTDGVGGAQNSEGYCQHSSSEGNGLPSSLLCPLHSGAGMQTTEWLNITIFLTTPSQTHMAVVRGNPPFENTRLIYPKVFSVQTVRTGLSSCLSSSSISVGGMTSGDVVGLGRPPFANVVSETVTICRHAVSCCLQ